MPVTIGIDLGTSKYCAAIVRDGHVEIIENQWDYSKPAFVAFKENEIEIGRKPPWVKNPSNNIFNFMRFIGRYFDDDAVQADIKYFPFRVICGEGGWAKFEVGGRYFTPSKIATMIFSSIKSNAEKFLGVESIKKAVIAVPTSFSLLQRQLTEQAAFDAGFLEPIIITDSIAAARAYESLKMARNDFTFMVYNLGGGTFSASIVSISKNSINVKSAVGDNHLGGEDFTNLLMDYVAAKFKDQYQFDCTTSPKGLTHLRNECENVKIQLSTSPSYYVTTITRAKFEELCDALFGKTMKMVEKALEDASMNKCEIDDIVLVGGSTRIPKIQSLLSKFFDGKTLSHQLNSDLAIAAGAAIYAKNLTNRSVL